MYFLGVDGGGTKTEFLLVNEKGKKLAKVIKPTSHYKQTSFENFYNIINSGINEVCKITKISKDDIDFTFLGLAGYGALQADKEKLNQLVAKILDKSKYKCAADSEVAWAGSLGGKPGINIVAGTGAIGYGQDYYKRGRSSGWGDLIGDEGSAYWLSIEMLRVFAKQADGRLIKSPLYNLIREKYNLENDFEILEVLLNDFERKRDKIAAMAPLLLKAAERNDKYAINIYKKAAKEHYLTVKALIKKMNFKTDEEIVVSYSGGVFKAKYYVVKPLAKMLKVYNKNIKLIKPILSPVEGAALLALIIYGYDGDKVLDGLLKSE